MLQRPALLLFLFALLSASAPLHPRTEPPQTTGWHIQPRGRGTFQIIVSCLGTLAICVWTSVHPNVQGGRGFMDHFLRKLKMALWALLIPEIVVSIAWHERIKARALHRALIYESWKQKKTKAGQAHGGQQEIKLWKRVVNRVVVLMKLAGYWIDEDAFPKQVAFFVIMGGYVNSKNEPVSAFQFFHAFKHGTIVAIYPTTGEKDGTTDTTTGPAATPQTNPDTTTAIGIKISDVLDKGKSSVLAKLIICGQVGWMVLQLIGREVSRLPMTLIELHTLIHICIAVIIFWLWWYKPLDVFEPIVLNMEFHPHTDDLAWSERPSTVQSSGLRKIIDSLWLLPLSKNHAFNSHSTRLSPVGVAGPSESGTPSDGVGCPPEATLHGNLGNLASKAPANQVTPDTKIPAQQAVETGIWARISRSVSFEYLFAKKENGSKHTDSNTNNSGGRTPTVRGSYKTILHDNLFACIFYFVYAALHAIAWSDYFSTGAEQWFWRVSCLVVGLTPAIIICIASISTTVEMFRMFILDEESTSGENPKKKIQYFLECAIGVIYLLASIGLLIEALVSLRRLPIGIYESVSWTAYIPHF